MSRVGQQPIEIPGGVDVKAEPGRVTARGPQGELVLDLPAGIALAVADGKAQVTRESEDRQTRSLHGTVRSLVANMVEGVSKGFKRELEITGVGFRAAVEGQKLTLNVGFSSPVVYAAPEGVKLAVENNGTLVVVSGTDKQQVGLAAARIRGFCPAEPYKGKGVQYRGERIRRKEGKTVA
jgi:large subunit ribosomal protein L6